MAEPVVLEEGMKQRRRGRLCRQADAEAFEKAPYLRTSGTRLYIKLELGLRKIFKPGNLPVIYRGQIGRVVIYW